MNARDKAVQALRDASDAGTDRRFPETVLQVLDEAGLAVVHAGTVVDRGIVLDRADEALRSAVAAQRADLAPHHAQFYAWGWLLTVLAEQLRDAAGVLRGQVEHYGDRRALRDDEGEVPARRLAMAAGQLAVLQAGADQLRAAAARFHSEIGHIAVDQQPEREDTT